MERAEGSYVIVNELGMHARAAAKLVRLASEFDCEVSVEKDGQRADAKSVMGVLLLCGQKGSEIVVRAEGPGAERAVSVIGELIRDRFQEER